MFRKLTFFGKNYAKLTKLQNIIMHLINYLILFKKKKKRKSSKLENYTQKVMYQKYT